MGTTEPDEDQRASAGQVLVGLDGSPTSRLALLAGARSALARAVALRAVVVEPPPLADGWSYGATSGIPTVPSPEGTARTRVMAAEELEATLARVRRERGRAPEAEVVLRTGDPARTLLHLVRDAAELVIGHHGHGLVASSVLGSVGMRAVLHAPCPVTVVRGTVEDDHREGGHGAGVMVGLDGSESSRAALRHALGEAVRRASPLTAVVAHRSEEIVWPSIDLLPMPQDLARIEVEQARAFVDETVTDLRAQGDRLPEVEVIGRDGSPVAVLTDAARDADLLVVGHRGRGALRSVFLGSTALGCLLRARCAVTVVPPAAHAEPVPRAAAANR